MAELVLYTTPSTWRLPSYRHFPEAYRRIIAVEQASGLVACRYPVPPATAAEAFEVTSEFADRVTALFEQYIAPEDPEKPGPPRPSLYNCHLAALALQGESVSYTREAFIQMSRDAEGFVTAAGNLPLGAHGVVTNMSDGSSPHSVVGMGVDVPDCLQVVDTNSHLGLMPYDVMMRNYSATVNYAIMADPRHIGQMAASQA
jgi:hypothetical protein